MIEALPAVPVETVTPIKPSEAIRLGCLIAPVQAFGEGRGWNASCALQAMHDGGALLGIGSRLSRDLRCPSDGEWWYGPQLVIHLNDKHKWSRERIADWLAERGL